MNTKGLYHSAEESGSAATVCADPERYRIKRRLIGLKEFAEANPQLYAYRTIRKLVWRRFRNGLHAAGATVQVGRKIFIDVDAFETWMQSRTDALAADAPHPAGTRLSRARRAKLSRFRDSMSPAPAAPIAGVSSISTGKAPRE